MSSFGSRVISWSSRASTPDSERSNLTLCSHWDCMRSMSKRGNFIAPHHPLRDDIVHSVRIGVQLPEVEREVRWPEVAAIARAAEESKFDSIWVGDHLLYRGGGPPQRGPPVPLTQLAAPPGITTRGRPGPPVAATAFPSPRALARMGACLPDSSRGRP